MVVGSKIQVWNGTADKTSGGLKRADLMKNKRGKVVSKKQHEAGMKNSKNLDGYLHKTKGVRTSARLLRGKGAYASRGGDVTDYIQPVLGAVSTIKDMITGGPDPDKQTQRDWLLREYNRVHGTQFGVQGVHYDVPVGKGLRRMRRSRK